MKTESELLLFYNSSLKPIIEPLEKFRVEKIEKIKRHLILSIPFLLFVFIGIAIRSKPLVIISFFVFIAFSSVALHHLFEMVSYLKKHFKYRVMFEIMNFLFDDYEYIPNQRIAKSVLTKSMLFPINIAETDGEDFMRFRMGETRIMFCEMFTFFSNNKLNFEGLFLSASFNKNFTSKTFVISRRRKNSLLSIPRYYLNDIKDVKLEDILFNKEFLTLSTDQVEARYILTPSLMQRILDYKKKTGKNISLSFVENRLYCTIPKYSNHFEPALFHPFNFEFIKYTCEPLRIYTDIVEDLNLNLRIWTKVE